MVDVNGSLHAGKAGEVETYWHIEISGKTNCVRLFVVPKKKGTLSK